MPLWSCQLQQHILADPLNSFWSCHHYSHKQTKPDSLAKQYDTSANLPTRLLWCYFTVRNGYFQIWGLVSDPDPSFFSMVWSGSWFRFGSFFGGLIRVPVFFLDGLIRILVFKVELFFLCSCIEPGRFQFRSGFFFFRKSNRIRVRFFGWSVSLFLRSNLFFFSVVELDPYQFFSMVWSGSWFLISGVWSGPDPSFMDGFIRILVV